mmetsp:Transcript_1769/g.5727  ORF Transcript_1769/g.5727 Transcript_1769/m.5727 type:complete len:347 (+) Transcript_1769:812-1852(+)
MQALFHIAEVRDLQVGTRGTRRPRPRSRDNGRAGDERRGDDEHHQTTASFRGFLQGERGAVHRIETGENSLLQVIPVPEIANNTLSGRCKLYLSTGLQVMHAGFCTVTHQDVTNSGFGVLAWLRQVAGVSLFILWSNSDGQREGLTHDTCEDDWESGHAWSTFFRLPSARMLRATPGCLAVIRPGTYHRVFSITPKVTAYGNYVDLLTIRDGIAAAPPQHLEVGKVRKDPFSIVVLLVEALRLEALAVRAGPSSAMVDTRSALRELLTNAVWAGFGNIDDRPDDIAADFWVQSQITPVPGAIEVLERANKELALLRGLTQDGDGLLDVFIQGLCLESLQMESRTAA